MSDLSPYNYHAYVSYTADDSDWVKDELIKRLKEAELIYIDEQGFTTGVPIVDEIYRAIRESRRTLIVISERYVTDTWQRFGRVLSVSYGLDYGVWRSLPVLKEKCPIPGMLSNLVSVDLSTSDEETWQRLIKELRAPLTAPTLDVAGPANDPATRIVVDATQGLKSLWKKIKADDAAAQAVNRYHDSFREAIAEIAVLTNYKDLHDELHNLQIGCFEPIVQQTKLFPKDEKELDAFLRGRHGRKALDALAMMSNLLRTHVSKMKDILKQKRVDAGEGTWIATLEEAHRELSEGINLLDKKRKAAADDTSGATIEAQIELKTILDATYQIREVLETQPSLINDRLKIAMSALRLPRLIEQLQQINTELLRIDEGIKKQVSQYEVGILALKDLDLSLGKIYKEHNAWQDADNKLRMFDTWIESGKMKLETLAPVIALEFEPLYQRQNDPWAQALKAGTDDLESLRMEAEELAAAIAEGDMEAASSSFQLFRNRAATYFFELDLLMKRQCQDLSEIGKELQRVDRELENM